MFIQTEPTPNPSTIKFLPGQTVMQNGSLNLRRGEPTARAPLATLLFDLSGVEALFFSGDFVSVTKADAVEWAGLKPHVLAVLMDFFSGDQPAVLEMPAAAMATNDSEIVTRIKDLIETRVRPAVARDGGDIVFERFEQGIVYLRMHGACAGCPSANLTLKHGVENMLRHYLPEVLEVRSAA